MTKIHCDNCKRELSTGEMREVYVGGYKRHQPPMFPVMGGGVVGTMTYNSQPVYTPLREKRLELCSECESKVIGKIERFLDEK